MDIIDNINRLLAERGISGAELSRSLGLSNAVYSQWNKKKTVPSNKTAVKIAEFFDVPLSVLYEDPTKKAPTPEGEEAKRFLYDVIDNASSEELQKIREYIEFIKSRR